MVAQEILDLLVWVRALVPEPFFYLGAMVKRLRRRPLKAKSRVRFSLALPGQYVGIPYGPCTREDGTASYKKQRRSRLGTSFLFVSLPKGVLHEVQALLDRALAAAGASLFLIPV